MDGKAEERENLPPPRPGWESSPVWDASDIAWFARLESIDAARKLAAEIPEACRIQGIGRRLRFDRVKVLAHFGIDP